MTLVLGFLFGFFVMGPISRFLAIRIWNLLKRKSHELD